MIKNHKKLLMCALMFLSLQGLCAPNKANIRMKLGFADEPYGMRYELYEGKEERGTPVQYYTLFITDITSMMPSVTKYTTQGAYYEFVISYGPCDENIVKFSARERTDEDEKKTLELTVAKFLPFIKRIFIFTDLASAEAVPGVPKESIYEIVVENVLW
jgi:hypothetical protein